MRWQVTADVHGAAKSLQKAVDPGLPLALLGDNLNLIDFRTLTGVATRVLGAGEITHILLALASGGAKKARAMADEVFFRNPGKQEVLKREVLADYSALAAVLPPESVVLHGNVDYPELLTQALGPRHLSSGRREIGGLVFGFLSGTGSYPWSMGLPGEVDDKTYEEALWSMGPVDVLCTHFPPAVEGVTYDTVARRDEGGGAMLNAYILETKPRLHLFGHVHNPRLSEGRLGDTRLLNVGGFRYHGRLTVLDLERI